MYIDYLAVCYCYDVSSVMNYCLYYLKGVYGFINNRWLFKPLSYEISCYLSASW